MIFERIFITIAYDEVEELKKKFFNEKDLLNDHFNEPTVLPIPDDAPSYLPRIVITTLREHGRLSISPEITTFEILYDENYSKDWELCLKYIRNKISVIFNFLDAITEKAYKYMGAASNVIYDSIRTDGGKKIINTLIKNSEIKNIYGIEVKYTFIEEGQFFVNIDLQNVRKYQEVINPNQAGELNDSNQTAESIGAIIEVNDRYSFNNYSNYKSDSGKLDKILDILNENITNRITKLVENGEYDNGYVFP